MNKSIITALWITILFSCTPKITSELSTPCGLVFLSKLNDNRLSIEAQEDGILLLNASRIDTVLNREFGYDCWNSESISWDWELNLNDTTYALHEFSRALSYTFQDSTCGISRAELKQIFGKPFSSGLNNTREFDQYYISPFFTNSYSKAKRSDRHQIFLVYENDRLANFMVAGTACIDTVLHKISLYDRSIIE